MLEAYLDGKLPAYSAEYRMQCADGSWKWVLARGKVVSRAEDGRPLRLIGTHADITERKRIEDQVQHMAFYDALTSLPNRRLLFDRLGQTLAQCRRTRCHAALMVLDLDNFKPLNDLHGHAVGDQLLIEVANRLRRCVREVDTVARFGGDEFVVVISELNTDYVTSVTEAEAIAHKIRDLLAQPYRLSAAHEDRPVGTVEHHCAASIGVAVFLDHASSQDDILRWADAAMYQAKDAGRNAIRFHHPPASPPATLSSP